MYSCIMLEEIDKNALRDENACNPRELHCWNLPEVRRFDIYSDQKIVHGHKKVHRSFMDMMRKVKIVYRDL